MAILQQHQITSLRAKKKATLLRQQAAVAATEAELAILDEAEQQLNNDQLKLNIEQNNAKNTPKK